MRLPAGGRVRPLRDTTDTGWVAGPGRCGCLGEQVAGGPGAERTARHGRRRRAGPRRHARHRGVRRVGARRGGRGAVAAARGGARRDRRRLQRDVDGRPRRRAPAERRWLRLRLGPAVPRSRAAGRGGVPGRQVRVGGRGGRGVRRVRAAVRAAPGRAARGGGGHGANIAGVRWTARSAYALVGGTLAVLLVVVAVGLSGRGPVDVPAADAGGDRRRARGRRAPPRGWCSSRSRATPGWPPLAARSGTPSARSPARSAGAGDHARRLPAGRERPARRVGPRPAGPADVPARRARGRVGGAGRSA